MGNRRKKVNLNIQSKASTSKRPNIRNLHAMSPLMKKGGVHEKSKGAKRAATKRATKKQVSEWRSRSSFFKRFMSLYFQSGILCYR